MNKEGYPLKFTCGSAAEFPMRKLLNNRWFVAALAIAALAFVWSSLRTPASAGRVAAVPAETASPAPEETIPNDTAVATPLQALKLLPAPKAPRDPFAIRAADEPIAQVDTTEQPDFVDTANLTGIWTQNGASLLVVNNRISQIGDTIGRLTIESADQQGIWLTHWKGRTYLAIGKSFVLKTPARLRVQASNP